jgi:hypothetical protein
MNASARDELLADLFTTALEGGIGYWSSCSEYHWSTDGQADLRGFFAVVTDSTVEVEDDPPTHRIDRDTIVKGYGLATTTWRNKVFWSSGEKPPLVITDDTDWDYDAGDADAIVQLGLFGEVVYG